MSDSDNSLPDLVDDDTSTGSDSDESSDDEQVFNAGGAAPRDSAAIRSQALELKDKGRVFVSNGDFSGALKAYGDALKLDTEGAFTSKEADDNGTCLAAVLFSNQSMCYRKLDQLDEARAAAHNCIGIDKEFVRGHQRLTEAHELEINHLQADISICRDQQAKDKTTITTLEKAARKLEKDLGQKDIVIKKEAEKLRQTKENEASLKAKIVEIEQALKDRSADLKQAERKLAVRAKSGGSQGEGDAREEVLALEEQIGLLEERLMEKDDEIEDLYNTLNTYISKEGALREVDRKIRERLETINQTANSQHKFNEQADFFYWQTYGILSEDYLRRLDTWKNVSQQDGGMQRSIDISILQKWVVENANFSPVKTIQQPDGDFKQVPDMHYAMNYPVPIAPEAGSEDEKFGYCENHPTDTLGSKFGREVVDHLVDTVVTLMDKNGSGRYPTSELWHRTQSRPLMLDEVLEKYVNKCSEFHTKMNDALSRLANSTSGKKKKKK